MNQATCGAAAVAALPREALRRVVTVLSVTEVTSWGVLYYALPVLAPSISTETGWSATAVLGAFSAGLVVSAVLGISVGGTIDRHGPPVVMTAGSMMTVPAVGLVAGLASTVFAPLAAVLDQAVGWRGTYLVLLAVLAGITVPLHWWGLRQPWARHRGITRRLRDPAPPRLRPQRPRTHRDSINACR